jgi:hypothetical protein
MADELDKILRKAKETNQKRRNDKVQEIIPEKPDVRPVTPPDDERYAVYRRLSPWGVGFVELVIFFSIAVVFLMLWVVGSDSPLWVWNGYDMFLMLTIATLALTGLRLLASEVYIYFTFSSFRKWRQQLPYRLEGWEQLADMPHFGKAQYWSLECKIAVEFSAAAKPAEMAFRELAEAFCAKLNRYYYPAFSSDPRTPWSFKDNELKGSINGAVARLTFRFLKTEMSLLAERYDQLRKITLCVDSNVEKVEPESSD